MAFVENRGQLDERARFYARGGGMTAYFTDAGFVMQLARRETVAGTQEERLRECGVDPNRPPLNERIEGANVFLTFEGASPDVILEGRGELPGRYNYLVGKDSTKWHTDVRSYGSLRYHGLYPGVDLEVREQLGQLEYDLLIEPGADLRQVIVCCQGAESLFIDSHGALVAQTALGAITQPRPATHQIERSGEKIAVDCAFVLLDANHFGFAAPSWEGHLPLVIDPLVYSTFIGGSKLDFGFAIAVDNAGAAYVAGETSSSDFPTTPGTFNTSYNGGSNDVFVTKLDASGSTLIFSTFLGGSGGEHVRGIAVDGTGAVYVTGSTDSPSFPTTLGAFQTTYNGGDYDAFMTKLDASGTALVYSTFLGGSDHESARAIAVDSAGAAYVAGETKSSDFPTTPGAFDTAYHSAARTGFVTKLDASGAALVYSTFLGGSLAEYADAIALDGAGAAYVTGVTASSDFPTTPGAFDTSFNGSNDAFVTKLDAAGSALVYSTLLGAATSLQEGYAITVDSAGAAYVAGYTTSSDFPTTPGAFDTTYNGIFDAFVTKFDASGSALVYSTFLGGSDDSEYARAIAVDSAGAAYVAGETGSTKFPTTPGAFDTSFNGLLDAFVTKLNASGSALAYSTFLGSSSVDRGNAIALNSTGAAYVAGQASSGFPTTPGAFDTSNNGSSDAFVIDLDLCASAASSNYGAGWPGTLGVPSLTSSPPGLCSQTTISVGNSRGAATQAVLVGGFSRASIPTAWGGTLLVLPGLFVPFTLPTAGASLPYLLCGDEFCGLVVDLQVLEVDPGASRGVSFTQGLELIHGR